MTLPSRNFWVGVVSRSHVEIGVKGGFIQLNHGKRAPVQKLKAGDGVVMYSPRTSYPDGDPLQAFRFGSARIPANDFAHIAEAMGAQHLAKHALYSFA